MPIVNKLIVTYGTENAVRQIQEAERRTHEGDIDLDLDVAVHPNGQIRLLDRDEFERHRELYGYPETVARQAEDAIRPVGRLE